MRTALITTTITVPHVLKLLRKYGDDIPFFVAGDANSSEDCVNFCTHDVPDTTFLFVKDQQKWKCSEPIGWNCIQRRNIALLEALKWGADIIVSWDTDNLPLNHEYFTDFEMPLDGTPFNGLQVSSSSGWFNRYGGAFRHRGFPPLVDSIPCLGTVTDVSVGVAAGLCIGDPDIDAYTRIAQKPFVEHTAEIIRSGMAVAPGTRCVYNTQNTAYLRQFAPAMFCAPGIGRGDDILASVLTQRLMWDHGYQLYIGPPFAWHERHKHDLMEDMRQDQWWLDHCMEVSDFITRMPKQDDLIDFCRAFWGGCSCIPKRASEAALAFLEDAEKVLA